MEELALGEMGMAVQELNNILPCTLFNKIRGYENRQRQEWERTRVHAYISIMPYVPQNENLTPQDIMPFPWDGEEVKRVKVDADQLAKERAERWARLKDKKK
jgi:hypothetical protein